jgi:2-iminobutanoate/2-iminopropanoate deaminase
MTFQKIETAAAPKATGAYSQAVSTDVGSSRLVFVSGQLPITPSTGALVNDSIEKATKQVIDNIEAILVASHSSLQRVIRVDVFMKDLNDITEMNKEYARRFTGAVPPARQTAQVVKLPLDSLVEISCVATCN